MCEVVGRKANVCRQNGVVMNQEEERYSKATAR